MEDKRTGVCYVPGRAPAGAGYWYARCNYRLNAAGLISGRTASTLVPYGSATRAEAATILKMFFENVVAI
jgi:hypothetical protein